MDFLPLTSRRRFLAASVGATSWLAGCNTTQQSVSSQSTTTANSGGETATLVIEEEETYVSMPSSESAYKAIDWCDSGSLILKDEAALGLIETPQHD